MTTIHQGGSRITRIAAYPIILLMLTLGLSAVSVTHGALAPAEATTKTGTVMVAKTQRMSGASLKTKQHGWYYKGSRLKLSCYVRGQSVFGWGGGPSNLWYRVSDGKYVADIDLYTRSNNPITGPCSSPPASSPSSTLSSRVDAFVKRWNGKYADFDRAYGAQCFDLFNFYNRDVVRAARAGGMYAYQIWDTYDRRKYTRVAATSKPRKGDVAVWGSNYIYAPRAGHVAIVTGASGSGFNALTQNPGATRIKYFPKSYLRGFLRPRV
jgi:hypothetical protein